MSARSRRRLGLVVSGFAALLLATAAPTPADARGRGGHGVSRSHHGHKGSHGHRGRHLSHRGHHDRHGFSHRGHGIRHHRSLPPAWYGGHVPDPYRHHGYYDRGHHRPHHGHHTGYVVKHVTYLCAPCNHYFATRDHFHHHLHHHHDISYIRIPSFVIQTSFGYVYSG